MSKRGQGPAFAEEVLLRLRVYTTLLSEADPKSMFPTDRRRLRTGAAAMAAPEPAKTEEAIHAAMEILGDGIRALQSTDDLGSPEANETAWQDMLKLSARYERLETELRRVKEKT